MVCLYQRSQQGVKMIEIPKPSRPGATAQRLRYGVSSADTWCLSNYLAKIISNGLRLLITELHGWPGPNLIPGVETFEDWQAKLEEIAMKLEFYSTDTDTVIFDHIDWSKDEAIDGKDLLDWLHAEDKSPWPGQNEYCEKTDIVEEVQYRFRREAFEWLTEYWDALWD